MSTSPQIIYNCNHIITKNTNEHGYLTWKRNRIKTDPDKIPANTKILRIDKVISIDESKQYYKGIHYKQTIGNNIIEWIPDMDHENPSPGKTYKILCSYVKSDIWREKASECERCFGNGWYIDILKGGSKSYQTEGQSKLVQDFIKVLFTDRLTEGGYGSDLKKLIGQNINEQTMPSQIMKCINDASDQVMAMQEESALNGIYISPDETLVKTTITRISFIRDELAYYVTIKVTNAEEEDAIFSFKF